MAQLWRAEESFTIARGLESVVSPKRVNQNIIPKRENTKVLYLGKAGSSPYLIYATTTDYVNNPILKY